MSRLFISAAHKSSGKTTITIGLCAALTARGLLVKPFKKGPDYIDPMWLGLAAEGLCRNLDFNTQSPSEIVTLFQRVAAGADFALIEGNKGLYDGVDVDGSDSSAAMAKLVEAPVILVVDASGITRGIAPLLVGYQTFDPDVHIVGVILNKVAGARHESKLRAAVEHYTNIPVLGAIRRSPDLEIVERHLGLIPSNEASEAKATIVRIRDAVAAQLDMDRILDIARSASPLAAAPSPVIVQPRAHGVVRIGIARDQSFGFYYPDDLEALVVAGAELVTVDTLHDAALPPNLDGLFIGGGFPETHMEALEANASFRFSVKEALDAGLPTYAECGGLMYLSRSVTWKGRTARMVGALPGDTVMHERPRGRGYVRLRETGHCLWPGTCAGAEVAAHEFHYSSLENLSGSVDFAYDVLRGDGIDGMHDGIIVGNTLATYSHMRSVEGFPWARRFVGFVRACSAIGLPPKPARGDAPLSFY